MDTNPNVSPDGQKIAFASRRSGRLEIWSCKIDGTDLMRLTHFEAPDTSAPCWSPDGRSIAFNSDKEGSWDIYVMDAQGGPPRRLTTDSSVDARPTWSRDGRWIYFSSNRTGDHELWRVPTEGGDEIQVTAGEGSYWYAAESADGRFLYYAKSGQLWRMPLNGGDETVVLEGIRSSGWELTAQGVYFIDPDSEPYPSIQFFDLATKHITQLGEVREPLLTIGARWMSVEPDGKWLLCTVTETEEDIKLVENFQ
jgi:Tol biopolymer transport system component